MLSHFLLDVRRVKFLLRVRFRNIERILPTIYTADDGLFDPPEGGGASGGGDGLREIAAMAVLLRDRGAATPALYLAGDPAPRIAGRVSQLLEREVLPLQGCDAALGCALIAEDVYGGAREVLGIGVDGRL